MMLDNVSAGQQEKSGVYSLLAGTSSGLLASQQQHSAAAAHKADSNQPHPKAKRTHTVPAHSEKPGSTSNVSAAGRLTLRPGAQTNSAHVHRPSQHQLIHGAKPQSPRSPRSPAGRGKMQPQRTSAPGSPLSSAAAPGSPHASSPRASAGGNRPSTPPRVPAYTAEELLRATRCQDPAPAAPSPCSSPPREHAAVAKQSLAQRFDGSAAATAAAARPVHPSPSRDRVGTAHGSGLAVPTQQQRQPRHEQEQHQHLLANQQPLLLQQQPRLAGALPQPLLQHGQAGSQQRERSPSPLHFSLQQQQQQQHGVLSSPLQQHKQHQDSAGSAPEAEASFGYLACEPGSSQGSPTAGVAVAGCTVGVVCPGQAPASRQVHCQHGEGVAVCVQQEQGQFHEQLQQEDRRVLNPGDQCQQQAVCLEQPGQPQQQQQPQGPSAVPQQEQQRQDRAAEDAAAAVELQHLQQHVMQSVQLLEQQQQHQGPQQQQQELQQQEEAQLCSQDVLNRPRDVSPEKQQQLLARLCAKHGLPLPHPRNLSKKQQRQPGTLWGPEKQQQQTARLTQRGGLVARKRDELLQQLRHSSVSRRKQPVVTGADSDASATAAVAGERPALGTAGDASQQPPAPVQGTDLDDQQQQQQEQQVVVQYGQAVTQPSPASQLHLVDGLQYVHALLGSIRMPSAGSTAAAGGTGGDSSWQGSLQISGGDPQLLLPGPQHTACLPAAGASSTRGGYCGQQQKQLNAPDQQQQQSTGERSQQQQQPVRLKGAGAGQLRELCSSALAKLSATARPVQDPGTGSSGGGMQYNLREHSSNSNRHHQLDMSLEDAMVLLGLVSDTQNPHHHHQHHQQQQQQQQCFAALHAAVQQHLRPPDGDPLHQQLQPSWHKQQQRQLAQGCCWGPRQLGMRAAAAVAATQQAWAMEQEVLPLWQCFRQVQQQLWRQQALAEASSSMPQRKQPGSPIKAARQAALGSPTTPRSPSKRWAATAAATATASPNANRNRTPPRSRLSPGRGVTATASSPRKQPLAATVVAKRLTVNSLLRGTADLAASCAGWEGTPLLIKLLSDLRNKLLCKLALQAMRSAVIGAAERDALLTVQLPVALSALNLSAGLGAWRVWAADRSGVRELRQQLREKVRGHRAADALRAWREAAKASAWLKARGEALTQQRQQMLRAKAFKAWRCARMQQQVDLAQHALAVLWRARVTVAQVLLAWAREARQAVLLAAMAWDESDSGDQFSSAGTSSNPSRRQSSSSAAFERCSRDLAAVLALQRPWRERMLGAVADTQQRCAEAFEAAGKAPGELRAVLPPLLVSAQLILQALQQQRRLKVQQQLQALGAQGSDGGELSSGSAARQPRAEWSALLLADDSSSYVLPMSNSSRRVSDTCADELQDSFHRSAQQQDTHAAARSGLQAGPAATAASAAVPPVVAERPATAAAADGEVHGCVQLQQPGGRSTSAPADSSTASQQVAPHPGLVVAAAAAALGLSQHSAAVRAGLQDHAAAGVAAAAAGAAAGVRMPSASESTGATAAGSVPTAGSAAAEQQCAQDSCSAEGPAAAGSSSGPCGTWQPAAATAAVPTDSTHAAGAGGGAALGAASGDGNAEGSSARAAAGGATPAAAAAGDALQGSCQYSSASMEESPGVVTSRPQSRLGNDPTAAAAAAAAEAGWRGAGASTSSESNWSSASPAVKPTAAAAGAAAPSGGAGGMGCSGDVVGLARRLQELLCRTAANPAAATLQEAAAATAAAAAAGTDGPAPPTAADGEVHVAVQLQQLDGGAGTAAAAAAPAGGSAQHGSSSVLGRDGAAGDSSSSSSGCSAGAVAAAVESLRARSSGGGQAQHHQQQQQQPCHLGQLQDTLHGQAAGHAAAAAAAAVDEGVGSPHSHVGSPRHGGITGQAVLETQSGQLGQPLEAAAVAAAAESVAAAGLDVLPEHQRLCGDARSSQASHDEGAAGHAAVLQDAGTAPGQQQQQQQPSPLGAQGSSSSSPTAALPDAEHSLPTLFRTHQQQQQQVGTALEQQLSTAAAAAKSLRGQFCEVPPIASQQQQQQQQQRLRQHPPTLRASAAAAADAGSVLSDSELLRCSLRHWMWLVRGRSLLVRVFAGAEAAWQDRARQEVQAVLDPGSGPHVQAFRLMRRVFDAWAAHAAARLQGAAAMAAGEAAAAYHSSRLAVRAWRAWRQYLAQAPAVQQRYSSALASLCLLGWYQHMLQQRQHTHSRGRLRAVLRSQSGCGSEQQWWRQRTMRKVVQRWRGMVVRGDAHYRLRLLASAIVSWQLAVEDTQQLLATFHSRWQHQRLLQHSLLLWRSLVLLLKQQRQEATRAESWHSHRLARGVLTAWSGYTAVALAERGAEAAAVGSYERRLMRKKLLQWSLVACASSAARVYYQHGLMQRVVGAWKGEVAAAAAESLQRELQQQHFLEQQQYGHVAGMPEGLRAVKQQQGCADHHQQQQVWQQGCWQQQQESQQVFGKHLLPPSLPEHLQQHQQHYWPQQQQQMQSAVCHPGVISSTSSWSPRLQHQQQQQHSIGVTTYHSSPGALGVGSRVTPAASTAAAAHNNSSSSCPGGISVNQQSSGGVASTQQSQQLQRAHAAAGLGNKLPPWLMGPEQGSQQKLQAGTTSLGGSGGVWSQPDHTVGVQQQLHSSSSRHQGAGVDSTGRGGSRGGQAAPGCAAGLHMAQRSLPASLLKHPTQAAGASDRPEKGAGREAAGRHSSSSGGGSSTGRKGSIAVPGVKHGAAAAARGSGSAGAAVVAVAAVGEGSPQGKRNVGGARGVGPAGRNAAAGAAAAVAPRRKGGVGSEPALKADAEICGSPAKLKRAVVQHTQLM